MKIAFIGWGSLIWDPRKLEINGKWNEDGPIIPVEFARISQDGRLTLVLYQNADPIKVLWAHAKTQDLCEARCNLKNREGTSLDKIEYVSLGNDENNCTIVPDILDVIRNWARTNNLDAVVWTGLPSNFEKELGKKFIENNAIEYLKGLQDVPKQKAKEYIQKAPSQIRTRVRDKIEQELGWKHDGNSR